MLLLETAMLPTNRKFEDFMDFRDMIQGNSFLRGIYKALMSLNNASEKISFLIKNNLLKEQNN